MRELHFFLAKEVPAEVQVASVSKLRTNLLHESSGAIMARVMALTRPKEVGIAWNEIALLNFIRTRKRGPSPN